MTQIALACVFLAAAAFWLLRMFRAAAGSASRWAGVLEAPRGAALAAYVVLWFHVLWNFITEQHVDSHSYVHQAAAWLRGELHIDRVLHDTIAVAGKRYTIFPPFPALVLLPLVALFGDASKTLLVTPFIGALTAHASMRALLRLEVPARVAVWCSAGLIFGTPLLVVSGIAVDSYFAHCCACACAMTALAEVTGRRRGWLIGLLLAGAVLSRQLSILMLPFFAAALAAPGGVWLARPEDASASGRPAGALFRVLSMLLPLGACLGIYALMNAARSGNWLDTGYGALVERGWYKYRAETFGNFHWAYLPSNLLRVLLLGPGLEFEPKSFMVPKFTGFGSSLTFTSPFLYFAFKDLFPRSGVWRGSRVLRALAWSCAGAIFVAVLLHKSALGGFQVHGQRYTLDFTPLLFPIAALGMAKVWTEPQGLLARWCIGYSIAIAILMLHVLWPLMLLLRHWPH